MIDTIKQEEEAPFSDKPMWLNAMIRILVSIWDVSLVNVGIVYPMYQVDVHFTYVICTRLVYYPI